MNYRHAFHAGGFADVVKHIVLVRMLIHLHDKPAAFRVIDSHAGAGLYDLTGEEAEERGKSGRSQGQCSGRPYSFVVHGLWPQYERGYPEYCVRPSPRLARNIMTSMLDLMPAPGLIYNEWDKHGTCSGLDPRAYFETIRKARAAVKIPDDFLELSAPKTIAPAEVEDAFIKANPGLSNSAVAVICADNLLSEVRICLSKDLQFQSCEEIDRRACRRDSVTMPPVRGG